MKIGVIQASSQSEKNNLIFDTVSKYAEDSEVINFGCFENEEEKYSYIEISLLAGLLLASGSVDLIVTGCSSGQGYPKSEAERKLKDTALLKDIRNKSQISVSDFYRSLDSDLVRKIFTKKDVIEFVITNGKDGSLSEWISDHH